MRMAIVRDGVVVNVAAAPVGWISDEGSVVPSDVAGIGWSYNGNSFSPPIEPPQQPPPVPQSVTPRQARLALLAAGLLDDVNAAVAAAGPEAQIDWDYALEIRRDNALIASMAAVLNLSKSRIDDLLRAAAVL